jgi:hypothetical protein
MAQKSRHNRNTSIVDRQILPEDTPAIDRAPTVQFTMATRAASVGVDTVVRVLVAMPLLAGATYSARKFLWIALFRHTGP